MKNFALHGDSNPRSPAGSNRRGGQNFSHGKLFKINPLVLKSHIKIYDVILIVKIFLSLYKTLINALKILENAFNIQIYALKIWIYEHKTYDRSPRTHFYCSTNNKREH